MPADVKVSIEDSNGDITTRVSIDDYLGGGRLSEYPDAISHAMRDHLSDRILAAIAAYLVVILSETTNMARYGSVAENEEFIAAAKAVLSKALRRGGPFTD